MGLSYMGLACDLEVVAGVYSSRDVRTFEALMQSEVPFVRSLLGLDEGGRKAQTRKGALRDIFVGARCQQYRPHDYGYAMEAVCFQLAESLGEVGGSYGAIYDAERMLGAVGGGWELLPQLQVEWFVPIPPMEDWPSVATLTSAECRAKADGLEAVLARTDADPRDNPRALVEGFAGWYRGCAESGRHLVIIAH